MLCTEVPMSQKQQVPARPSEAWTGMVVFGAVLFVVLGAADAMMGFAAAFNRGLYDVPAVLLIYALTTYRAEDLRRPE
jgi:hypothetical protein